MRWLCHGYGTLNIGSDCRTKWLEVGDHEVFPMHANHQRLFFARTENGCRQNNQRIDRPTVGRRRWGVWLGHGIPGVSVFDGVSLLRPALGWRRRLPISNSVLPSTSLTDRPHPTRSDKVNRCRRCRPNAIEVEQENRPEIFLLTEKKLTACMNFGH